MCRTLWYLEKYANLDKEVKTLNKRHTAKHVTVLLESSNSYLHAWLMISDSQENLILHIQPK